MGTQEGGEKLTVRVWYEDEENNQEDVTLGKDGIQGCEREVEKQIIDKIKNDLLF